MTFVMLAVASSQKSHGKIVGLFTAAAILRRMRRQIVLSADVRKGLITHRNSPETGSGIPRPAKVCIARSFAGASARKRLPTGCAIIPYVCRGRSEPVGLPLESVCGGFMGRILGVIPARLEATRLPRKPLRLIAGQPMIAWVYHRARQAPSLNGLLVATDSEEIQAFCRAGGIPVVMTSAAHRSGTDRIVEVMGHEAADIYVNVQGDEPMVTAEHIELMLRPFRDDPATRVSTLKVAITPQEARNPNNTKVVTDATGRALYFSRAAIPFDRDASGQARNYKHLGLYAYRGEALGLFSKLAPSELEEAERLEQLRFLENGIPITVVETAHDTIGVDSEEDLKKVEEHFRRAVITL